MTGLPKLVRVMGFGFRRPVAACRGRCVAGTVGPVGPDVTELKPGDDVYGICDASFADFARASAGRIAPKPADLSFEQAAVPVSGLAAMPCGDRAQVQAGQSVLVIGASSGVGSFAFQLAKAFGAEVTGVCSTTKVELVRALGADHVVDYTERTWPTAGTATTILDAGGNCPLSQFRRALTPHGTLVIVGGETGGRWLEGADRLLRAPLLPALVSQKLSTLITSENSKDLMVLRVLLETGKVAPAIDRTYPLSSVPAAIRYVQEGHARGKVVITV